MNKPLIAVVVALLTLPLGCKVEDDTPDPLASKTGFCSAWADNACQANVVEFCGAKSADACKGSQSKFCLGLLPDKYSSKHAKECLDAVKAAYADGNLTPEEITTVIDLGAPCDQLSTGTVGEGDTCKFNAECNTAGGLTCIMKLGTTEGVCATPEEVGGGEACDGDAQVCAGNFYCDGANCIAYKKTGKACDADFECTPENHCAIATGDTTETCVLRADLDEACNADADCQSGYCPGATSDTPGQCTGTIRLGHLEPLCTDLK